MNIVYNEEEEKKSKRNFLKIIGVLLVALLGISIWESYFKVKLPEYSFDTISSIIFQIGYMTSLVIACYLIGLLFNFEKTNKEIALEKKEISDLYKKARLEYKLNKLKNKK